MPALSLAAFNLLDWCGSSEAGLDIGNSRLMRANAVCSVDMLLLPSLEKYQEVNDASTNN